MVRWHAIGPMRWVPLTSGNSLAHDCFEYWCLKDSSNIERNFFICSYLLFTGGTTFRPWHFDLEASETAGDMLATLLSGRKIWMFCKMGRLSASLRKVCGSLESKTAIADTVTFWGPCQERNVRRFCGVSLGLARQSTCHMGAAILLQLSVKKCRPVWWLLMSEQILIVQQRSTTVPTIWLT